MSIYDFVKEPSLLNFGMLAWDVVSLVLGIPGSYVAKGFKYADRLDDSIDGARALGRIGDGVDTLKIINRIGDTIEYVKCGDEISDLARTTDIANRVRQAENSFSCVLTLAYISARDTYRVEGEEKSSLWKLHLK